MQVVIDYTPTDKQVLFHTSTAEEILYGGAAGGGKSKAIVMDALFQALKYPNCQPYLFRRTYTELQDTLITEMYRSYPEGLGTYNGGRYEYQLKNGSLIRFRHCNRETDVYNYKGSEMSHLYIDELTSFTEFMVNYLSTRVRTNVAGLVPLKRFTTNPGDIGHAFVYANYVDGYEANEVKEIEVYSELLNKTKIVTRQFIPAFVQDNEHINEGYIFELEQKPEAVRKALLLGDWKVFEGQVFAEWRDTVSHYDDRLYTHVIRPFEIPKTWDIYCSFDWGFKTPFSLLWWTIDQDGTVFLIKEWYGCYHDENDIPNHNKGLEIEPEILAKMARDMEKAAFPHAKKIKRYADPSIFAGTRGESIGDTMRKNGFKFEDPRFNKEIRHINDRIAGKMQYHRRLRFDESGMASFYSFSTNKFFNEHIPLVIYSKVNPEDVDTTGRDHDYDSGRYFFMTRKIKPPMPAIIRPHVFNPLMKKQKRIKW